jgi:hypothetical protein
VKSASEVYRDPWIEPEIPTKLPIMLALFDVLGFSNRLESQGIEQVVALYHKLIDEAVLQPSYRCLGLAEIGDGKSYPTLFTLPVRYAYFSDTILLWAPLEQLYAAAFLDRCVNLFCEALRIGVPMRGAVALGDAVMHRPSNTFIGTPIVEAARAEALQRWIGLCLCHSATWPHFLAEVTPQSIIEYNIPVKEGAAEFVSPVAVDWPRRWRDLRIESASDKLAEMNLATPHPYYQAAQHFVDFSAQNADWFNEPDDRRPAAKLRLRPKSEALSKASESSIDKQ